MLSDHSDNGSFLVKLGVKTSPPLRDVLEYASSDDLGMEDRIKVLDFIVYRLNRNGNYHDDFKSIKSEAQARYRMLPCVSKKSFGSEHKVSERHSPLNCYSAVECGALDFPVLDPALGDQRGLYARIFQCPTEPAPDAVLKQFLNLVDEAKVLQHASGKDAMNMRRVSNQIDGQVTIWYEYLSKRCPDLCGPVLHAVKGKAVIACRVDGGIEWLHVDKVFFSRMSGRDKSLTESLFRVVEYNPFLAKLGGTFSQTHDERHLSLCLIISTIPTSQSNTKPLPKNYSS